MTPTIKPHPKQHLAWQFLKDAKCKLHCGQCPDCMACENCLFASVLTFGGGAGGGKSWLGCEWILTNCYLYPGSKWYIGREELTRLMQSAYLTWQKVCTFHNIPREDWTYNGQYHYIEFVAGRAKGSRVDLLDLKYLPTDPDYERFGSLEYTGGWIEEAGEVDFKAFDVLKSRVGRHLNRDYRLPGKTLLTCNPNKGWLYREIYRPHKEGKLPPNYGFIQSLYNDNPHTAGQYGRELKQIKDPATKSRLMFGKWEYDSDPTALIDYDAIVDLFTNTAETSEEKYMTVDVARFGGDKTVIGLWKGLSCYQIHTYEKQGTDITEQRIKEFCESEKIPRSHVIVDEDGIGGGVVDHVKGVKGFIANTPAIENAAGDKENFQHLKAQCYYYLADEINHHNVAVKTDSVVVKDAIIEELEQVKSRDADKDGKLKVLQKEDIKELIGRSPDYADMLMMRMYFELQEPEERHVARQWKPNFVKRRPDVDIPLGAIQ